MKLAVNALLCDGYGKCERIAPNLVRLDEDGVVQVLVQDELTPEQIEEAQAAINLCPVNAITLTTDATVPEPVPADIDAAREQSGESREVMPVFEQHVFVCTSGEYCPSKDGDSKQVHKTFKELVAKAGLKGKVRINNSGCLDQCGHGPMAVVYPEGVWYSHLGLNDVSHIVDEHLVSGRPVARLRYHPPKMGKNKLARDANECRLPGQVDGCRAEWPIVPFPEAPAGLSEDER